MSTFKDRLVEEHSSLYEKIEKLSIFIKENKIFNDLSDKQQKLLKRQLEVMLEYHQILIERIKDIG